MNVTKKRALISLFLVTLLIIIKISANEIYIMLYYNNFIFLNNKSYPYIILSRFSSHSTLGNVYESKTHPLKELLNIYFLYCVTLSFSFFSTKSGIDIFSNSVNE